MNDLAIFVLSELEKQPLMPSERRALLLKQLAAALATAADVDDTARARVAELSNDLADCAKRQAELDMDVDDCSARQLQLLLDFRKRHGRSTSSGNGGHAS